jgi:drug/metabolite transporter (DMT)-like permease
VTSEPRHKSPAAGGWYVDPSHPGRLRYFDGCHWTVETRDRPGYQPPGSRHPANRSPSARGLTIGIVIVCTTLAGLLTVVGFAASDVYAGAAMVILAFLLCLLSACAIALIRVFVWARRGPPLGVWWLAILLTGCLGGLVGYLVLRPTEPQRARVVLRVGIPWTVFAVLGSYVVWLLLLAGPVRYD